MSAGGLFSSRTLTGWATLAVLLFAVMLYLMFFVQPDTPTGPSAFSRSAIGYAGIADIMHRSGARVIKSRGDSLAKVGTQGGLIIAEPDTSAERLRGLYTAPAVLLVLPKWIAEPDKQSPGWVKNATRLGVGAAQAVARTAVPDAEVVRVAAVATWSVNEIGDVPRVVDGYQLIKSNRLRPVVASADGMLVGELRAGQHKLWVLADPDVMANHGLPGNAAFATTLINRLRGADGNVVFDETVHGFTEQPRSPFWMLFEFPFVLATIQGVIAIAILLWATMGRFGTPLIPPVAMASGKTGLIENTAKLFELARYEPVIVKRYVYAVIRDVARQLHAPSGISDTTLVEWLRRTGKARAATIDCGSVLRAAGELATTGRGDMAPLAALARDIFRWKREITDGVSRDSSAHRNHSRRGQQSGGGPG
jgi:hypothetical protein